MSNTHLESEGAWLPDTIEIIRDAMTLDSDAFEGTPAQKWLEVATGGHLGPRLL